MEENSEQIIKINFKEFINKQINNCLIANHLIEYNFYDTNKFTQCDINNKTTNVFATYRKALTDMIFAETTFNYFKGNYIEIDDNCDFYDPFVKNVHVEQAENIIKQINNGYYHIVYGNEFILVHLTFPRYRLEIIKRIYH